MSRSITQATANSAQSGEWAAVPGNVQVLPPPPVLLPMGDAPPVEHFQELPANITEAIRNALQSQVDALC